MIMSRKKNKGKGNKPAAESRTHELVLANKVSGSVHGGLSRIRLSLTFRIAWHYCIQLLRSVVPVSLIITAVLCAAVITLAAAVGRPMLSMDFHGLFNGVSRKLL